MPYAVLFFEECWIDCVTGRLCRGAVENMKKEKRCTQQRPRRKGWLLRGWNRSWKGNTRTLRTANSHVHSIAIRTSTTHHPNSPTMPFGNVEIFKHFLGLILFYLSVWCSRDFLFLTSPCYEGMPDFTRWFVACLSISLKTRLNQFVQSVT